MASLRKFRKSALTAMCIAIGAVSLSACYSGNLQGQRTAVIGDSITNLAAPDIQGDLSSDYAWNVQSIGGQPVAGMAATLQTMLADPQGSPQNFIVNLGTDDVFEVGEDSGYNWQTPLATEVAALASTPCVIMVNINTDADIFWGTAGVAEAMNAQIDTDVAAHPNFHLLDWNAIVHTGNNDADWIDTGSAHVHPNAAGQAEIGALYNWTLHVDCP